jgi:predicted NUDIX family NTP pyrophosphohydrolase
MPKFSAGIALYRPSGQNIEVLLVHPGGPFWAKKDDGSWSFPKGEYLEDEDAFVAAQREFKEETGFDLTVKDPIDLGEVKYGNKQLRVWAVKGSADARRAVSNMFTMEWPPKTGRKQEFPEVDRAGWFLPADAKLKLVKGQIELVDRLCEQLGASVETGENSSQMSLL